MDRENQIALLCLYVELGDQLDRDVLTSKIKGVGCVVGAVPEELTTLAAPSPPLRLSG